MEQSKEFPHKIGKYQIIKKLGMGGMGCVYKAIDPQINKFVALKILLENEEQQIQRFIREARAMAKLNHPNIVKIYVVEQSNGYIFFTMDYIEGLSLKEYLKDTKINIRLFSETMIKIGKAIAYAHKQGIIHRDLKPSNILLDKNKQPYIVDFGIAKLNKVDKSLTKKGVVLGTLQYMSPEQAAGEKVNHLTDVYALGAIFYEMLAARPLIKATNPMNIIYDVIFQDPILLRQVNNKLSKDLETICHKAVAKKRKSRYQSAEEFTQDIERFLHGEIIKARPYSLWEKVGKKFYRNTSIVATVIVGALIVAVGIWMFEKKHYLDVYPYLTKAEQWQQKIAMQKIVSKQIEIYMEISNLLEKALEISPKDWQLEQYRKAIADFSTAIALNPKFPQAYNNRGNAYLKIEENVKAVSDFSVAIALNPKYSQAYSNRAIGYHVLKKYAMGIADCNKAIALNSKSFLAYNSRAIAYQETKEDIKAIADLNQAIALNPRYSIAYSNRGASYKNLGKYNKAMADFNKAIALDSKTFQAYCGRAGLYYDLKKYFKSIVDYNKAIALKKSSLTYYNRGNAYQYTKNYVKAIADYSKAISLNPKFSEAYVNRGGIYLQFKQYQKCYWDFQMFLKLAPNHPIAPKIQANASHIKNNLLK